MGGNQSCAREKDEEKKKHRDLIQELLERNRLLQDQVHKQYDITLKNSKLNLYPNDSIISDWGSEIHCHPFIRNSEEAEEVNIQSSDKIQLSNTNINDNYREADLNTKGYTKISDIGKGAIDS